MFLTFAAAVGVALGACPNQCSGHGYCDQNDRCVCFRAPGTKSMYKQAYTGADCSQRMCPFGMAHAEITDITQELAKVNYDDANAEVALIPKDGTSQNHLKAFLNNGFLLERDVGVDIKVVSKTETPATVTFQYKFDFERTFRFERTSGVGKYHARSNAFHVVSGTQSKEIDTGLYIYWDLTDNAATYITEIQAGDRYYLNVTRNGHEALGTDNFKPWNPNTAHNLIECSGKGICDRAAGSCKCATGYTGDACQRTVCVNDCSGHGVCQSQAYFAEDASTSYDGYDASSQVGCKCDSGFRGADCSMVECPSGADPMGGDGGAEGLDCSGRGTCDYTSGACQCFKGYFGERCEEQTNLV